MSSPRWQNRVDGERPSLDNPRRGAVDHWYVHKEDGLWDMDNPQKPVLIESYGIAPPLDLDVASLVHSSQ